MCADRPSRSHRRRRVAACTGVLAAAAYLVPAQADAHVSAAADVTAAGSTAVVTLNVPHGCDGSPTTAIAVRIPAGIDDAVPTVNPGWTLRTRTAPLAEPLVLDDGDRIDSRVAEVVWTARTPLPDGVRDTLSVQVQLPTSAGGRVLAFPTVQTCAAGRTRWTEIPAAGQDVEELEHPAPAITVTTVGQGDEPAAAQDHGGDHAASPGGVAEGGSAGGATSSSPPASAAAVRLGTAGLVVGSLGLLTGIAALARRRPRPAPIERRDDRP